MHNSRKSWLPRVSFEWKRFFSHSDHNKYSVFFVKILHDEPFDIFEQDTSSQTDNIG